VKSINGIYPLLSGFRLERGPRCDEPSKNPAYSDAPNGSRIAALGHKQTFAAQKCHVRCIPNSGHEMAIRNL
jgi:hypothetical protein